MEVGAVCLQVLSGSAIPFNTDHVVSQAMYFCANAHCIKNTSSYVHVPYPTAVFCHQATLKMKKKPLEENAILPYTETNKLAYPLIFT